MRSSYVVIPIGGSGPWSGVLPLPSPSPLIRILLLVLVTGSGGRNTFFDLPLVPSSHCQPLSTFLRLYH